MKFLSKKSLAAAATLALAISSANASVVVLDFEGINATYPTTNYANVLHFYNGGTSSAGTTGTDYGIDFSSEALAICLNTIGSSCSNTSRGGLGNVGSDKGALFFLSGSQTYMNVAAGFDTGFSFFYTAINSGGSVTVYDGVNGAGNVLATLTLPTTTSACVGFNAGFCPFVAAGIGFSGTAKSVSFAGVANQVVFDDVTFGAVNPGGGTTVPEPASLALVGLALAGAGLARKRKAV